MLYKKSTAAWRTISGKEYYFRSMWESNYARWLDMQLKCGMIQGWEHEPATFWFEDIKRGVRSYLPDFRVTNNHGLATYHEVKGYYDAKSKTKIKRFRKYYPEETLILIDKKWFAKNSGKLKCLIDDWECGEYEYK